MQRFPALAALATLAAFATATLAPAQQSGPTAMPGDPFTIRQTWQIGGEGNWDSLAVDPATQQLFIAHGPAIQIVDLESGTLTAQIPVEDASNLDAARTARRPLNEAHSIALDPSGQYGFVSVGRNGNLQVFDRTLLKIIASVPTAPGPRAIVYEPLTRLLFIICPPSPPGLSPLGRPLVSQTPLKSLITIVDTDKFSRLGDIQLFGSLGAVQADSHGHIFVNVVDRGEILAFDAQAVANSLRQHENSPDWPLIDWTPPRLPSSSDPRPAYFRAGCPQPSGLAIDSTHDRLFVTCSNLKLSVLNSASGALVASLDIGLGTDTVVYDPGRGLIFAANAGGLGSLSIIRQDVTDSYAVIQNLPTLPLARTLAVNPVTGNVYLVAGISGFDLSKKGSINKPGTLPVIQPTPVPGSFQVLVIGH
jgi:DNA-binding beta-propeller fold protein YncE